MRIKIESYGEVCEYESLKDYAELMLDGDDYGNGVIEATANTARNNSQAIGRLLDLMAEKGLVSAEEITTVVEGYMPGVAIFERLIVK